ncbi:MAG: hypothetical protein ACI8VC_001856 [Candidatus Endobugula sp.]|jgi:hypothetical protein
MKNITGSDIDFFFACVAKAYAGKKRFDEKADSGVVWLFVARCFRASLTIALASGKHLQHCVATPSSRLMSCKLDAPF